MNYHDMKKFGRKYFGEMVDITDPCYDKDTWCRMTKRIVPGDYELLYNEEDEGAWGTRVSEIAIFNEKYNFADTSVSYLGTIGVDAGLAGFFNNKKDYNDSEWMEFCEKLRNHSNVWDFDDGFFSESGYGDGEYSVWAYRTADDKIVGISITFIEEYEEEDELTDEDFDFDEFEDDID